MVPVDFIGENHFLYQPQFTLAWPLSSGIPLGFDGWYELWRPWWSGQPDEGPRWPGGPHQDGGLWRLCGGAKHPGVRPPSTPLSHLSTAAVTLSPSPRFSLWAQVGLPRPLLLLLPHPDGLLSPWTFPASGLPAPSILLPLPAASRRRWAATGGQCGHQAGAVSQSRWISLSKIHQNGTISISGPGDPSQQSTSASTASIAELNQSTSKGHEILNQVYFLFSLSASHIFLGHEVKIPISHISFIFCWVTYFLRSRHPQSFSVDIFFVQVFQQATMPIRLVPVRARKYPNRPSKTPVRTSLDHHRCCL